MSARAISVTISTSDEGFLVKIKESETLTDEDTGLSHKESETASQEFAVYKSALQAATAMLGKFEGKLQAPEGELFGG